MCSATPAVPARILSFADVAAAKGDLALVRFPTRDVAAFGAVQ